MPIKNNCGIAQRIYSTFPNPTNDLLFFNDNYNLVNPETLNMRLHDLEKDAKIETGKLSLTWHCFRKMIISTAKNLQIDPDVILLMTGKAVEKSMLPYLNGIDVKTAFIKLQAVTGLNSLNMDSEQTAKLMLDRIARLEHLSDSQRRVTTLETTNQVLRKNDETQRQKIAELEAQQNISKEIMGKIDERLTYYETHGKRKPYFDQMR